LGKELTEEHGRSPKLRRSKLGLSLQGILLLPLWQRKDAGGMVFLYACHSFLELDIRITNLHLGVISVFPESIYSQHFPQLYHC